MDRAKVGGKCARIPNAKDLLRRRIAERKSPLLRLGILYALLLLFRSFLRLIAVIFPARLPLGCK